MVKWGLRVKVVGGALALYGWRLVQFPVTTITKQRRNKSGINVRKTTNPEIYVYCAKTRRYIREKFTGQRALERHPMLVYQKT